MERSHNEELKKFDLNVIETLDEKVSLQKTFCKFYQFNLKF